MVISVKLPDTEFFGQTTDRTEDWRALAKKARYNQRELAKLIAVSVRTLDRYFQKERGMSSCEWLGALRLLRARELLREGAAVKEAAYETGFKQVSHFSRVYRKRFGQLPSQVFIEAISAYWKENLLEHGLCGRNEKISTLGLFHFQGWPRFRE